MYHQSTDSILVGQAAMSGGIRQARPNGDSRRAAVVENGVVLLTNDQATRLSEILS
jgi:hypothetical protein